MPLKSNFTEDESKKIAFSKVAAIAKARSGSIFVIAGWQETFLCPVRRSRTLFDKNNLIKVDHFELDHRRQDKIIWDTKTPTPLSFYTGSLDLFFCRIFNFEFCGL